MSKPFLLFLLLLGIFISAHEILPKELNNKLGNFLAMLGLDVAMTPLTTDMLLMQEPSSNSSYYQRNINLIVFDQVSEKKIPWELLGFYQVRIPLQLMSEYASTDMGAKGFVHAICFQLKKIEDNILAFKVELLPSKPDDALYGLNKIWKCTP